MGWLWRTLFCFITFLQSCSRKNFTKNFIPQVKRIKWCVNWKLCYCCYIYLGNISRYCRHKSTAVLISIQAKCQPTTNKSGIKGTPVMCRVYQSQSLLPVREVEFWLGITRLYYIPYVSWKRTLYCCVFVLVMAGYLSAFQCMFYPQPSVIIWLISS